MHGDLGDFPLHSPNRGWVFYVVAGRVRIGGVVVGEYDPNKPLAVALGFVLGFAWWVAVKMGT